MNNEILIIIAHPDDELLGMGGTIKKLINEGKNVNILLLSKPGNARICEKINIRLDNFKTVTKRLGVLKLYYENFPDNGFDTIPLLLIIRKIEEVIDIIKPEVVYTHFYNDLNIDHSITSRAVLTVLRPLEKYKFIKKILLFEVLSTTELSIGLEKFNPNYYVDIKDYISQKKDLLLVYETELQKDIYPRSLEGIYTLAKIRGMESGLEFAEAFILYRSIN